MITTAKPKQKQGRPLPRLARAPKSDSAIPEELLSADVKWDNIKPVDPETELAVRVEFAMSSRVALHGPAIVGSNHADRSRKFHMRAHEVRDLTDRAMEVLLLFAKGLGVRATARELNAHPKTVGRVVDWLHEFHGLRRLDVRAPGQQTPWAELPDAIRAAAYESERLATA